MKTGEKIINRTGSESGVITGGKYPCRQDGCRGRRVGIRWRDGKITFPCTKGIEWKMGSWRIM